MEGATYCAGCNAYYFNATHICVPYDPASPCVTCGAAMVTQTVAAPGVGAGRQCRNGHYHGTCRELTPEEVV